MVMKAERCKPALITEGVRYELHLDKHLSAHVIMRAASEGMTKAAYLRRLVFNDAADYNKLRMTRYDGKEGS